MPRYTLLFVICAAVVLATGANSWAAAPLLRPVSTAVGIGDSCASEYPNAESPAKTFDGDPTSKYLNFAKENSGFIVTPTGGATIIQSLGLTTANDSPDRDPASYKIYGTNSPIVSWDNTNGDQESWTLITGGDIALPDTRSTAITPINFSNTTAYSSYRVVFPTLKNGTTANSMQVAEVGLYQSADGSGTNVLTGGVAKAIDLDKVLTSSYPDAENPSKAIDGITTGNNKYLNFGRTGTGLIISPNRSDKTVTTGIQFTSANDASSRDPMTWALYGTDDPITSAPNSWGDAENWTLIATGNTGLTTARNTTAPLVTIDNMTAYSSYRVMFTSLRNAAGTNSMQVAEVQLFGSIVPEPATLALLAVAALGLRRNRR